MKVLEWTAFYIVLFFSRRARGGINYVVSGRVGLKFALIQAFMQVLNKDMHKTLMPCKNEEDPNKNEDTRVFTLFLLL